MLIAPDKFRGTLTAIQAAAVMARGARALNESVETVEFPMADGGDGTLEVLCAHIHNADLHTRTVEGPLGETVEAGFLTIGGDAWVEMASCSGLVVSSTPLRPLNAGSMGTGVMMRRAVERAEVKRTIVGVGGSASTDGGTGAARAFGWRFLDRDGRDLPPGGGALVDVAHIEPGEPSPTEVLGACDVDSPLLGPEGAASAFAAQKGATDQQIRQLEEGLSTLAEVIARDTGVLVEASPHGGAGGGMGAGLSTFFDARLLYGFDVVAESVRFDTALARCDLVVTGEGAYDLQSSRGKVVHRVAEAAAARGVPCVLVAGDIRSDPAGSFLRAVSVSETYGPKRARLEAVSAVAKATMEALAGSI